MIENAGTKLDAADILLHFPYEQTICTSYLNVKPRQVCRKSPVLFVSTI